MANIKDSYNINEGIRRGAAPVVRIVHRLFGKKQPQTTQSIAKDTNRPALSMAEIEKIACDSIDNLLIVHYNINDRIQFLTPGGNNMYCGQDIFQYMPRGAMTQYYAKLKREIDTALPRDTEIAAIMFKSIDPATANMMLRCDFETLPNPKFAPGYDVCWRAIAYNKQMGYFPAQSGGWQFMPDSMVGDCLQEFAEQMLTESRAHMWAGSFIIPQLLEKYNGGR